MDEGVAFGVAEGIVHLFQVVHIHHDVAKRSGRLFGLLSLPDKGSPVAKARQHIPIRQFCVHGHVGVLIDLFQNALPGRLSQQQDEPEDAQHIHWGIWK